jgi:RimJ/RimL family protein N-acetyltransferase
MAMQLETRRLLLREYTLDDWPAVNAYTSDPQVVQYMSFGPTTPEQTREHLQWAIAAGAEQPRSLYELGVVLRSENRLIGTATLQVDSRERRQAHFSYLFHREFWGQGYATEAIRHLIHFGFTELHLHRVADDCDARNLASARVMEKLGMRREGHLRETIWKDGHWYDEYLYAILAHEWDRRMPYTE